jgi:hypothetical protein
MKSLPIEKYVISKRNLIKNYIKFFFFKKNKLQKNNKNQKSKKYFFSEIFSILFILILNF